MASILAELRRRNVFKSALAYLAVGWLLIGAGDIFFPLLDAPDWAFKIFILIIALGLPFVIVFAWVFEFTPDGLKLEKDVDRSQSITDQTGKTLNRFFIPVLIAALGVSVYLNVTGNRSVDGTANAIDIGQSIAVLPFSNRSSDQDHAAFVDGIHDDLLTNLAHIGALKVISRTSVMAYRDTTKKIRQIADELGVATVLEGAVQRAGDNVRINVQLIDARTDDHIWAQSYDRVLTTKNIFEIQSEIARQISAALKTTLTASEEHRLQAIPTDNLEAYNLYRAGRRNLEERQFETAQLARTQFEQAIALDPGYSEAYSGLADSLLLLHINHNAISANEAYPLAQQALDKALALDPNNADAYASLGLLKQDMWRQTRGGPQIQEAEAAFKMAIDLNSNHARAFMWYASLKGDQRKLDEAIALYQRSQELDPLGRIPYANLPGLYAAMGRNQKALDEWLDAVRLHPGWPTPYQNISHHLLGLGRIDEAIAWAVKAAELDTDPLAGGNLLGGYLVFRDTQKLSEFIAAIPEGHPLYAVAPIFRSFYQSDYAGAIAVGQSLTLEGATLPTYVLDMVSDAAVLIGDFDTATRYALLAQPALERDPIGNLDIYNSHNVIKLAYIALRRGEDAHAAELLRAALPVIAQRPRLGGKGHGVQDVQVLALLNRPEEALRRLRAAIDAGFRAEIGHSNWTLEADPYLATLRNQPQFRVMLDELRGYLAQMQHNTTQAQATGNWQALRTLAYTQPVNPAASIN